MEHEPDELQLLTLQLVKATERNKDLQTQLAATQEEVRRAKISIEKLTFHISEQEKKSSQYQELAYTSKKSQEQKWEIERNLEEQKAKFRAQQTEYAKLESELDEKKQQQEQQERVIQFLRERSEEFNLEAKQLKEDYQSSLETIMQLREELSKQDAEQRDNQQRLEKSAREKSELEEELQLVVRQLENIKQALEETQNLTQDQKIQLEENLRLKSQLDEQTRAWEQTQHEIQTIRQSLVRTLKDSKKLEIQFQEVLNERISLSNRAAQLQNLLDLQIDQTRMCQEQILEAQQRETRAKLEFEQKIQSMENDHRIQVDRLTAQISESGESLAQLTAKYQEMELDLLQSKEQAIAELSEEYDKAMNTLNEELSKTKREYHEMRADFHQSTQVREELRQEIQSLSHQLNTAQSDANEKENELRISQQHLAKKVKEVTLLQDKIDVQQQRLDEISRSLAASEQKNIDLEKVIADEQNRLSLFHEQLTENIKASEAKAAKVEEKYMDLHQKWAATEARNRELEKLADRHMQMQNQMQQFFGGFTLPSSPMKPMQNNNELLISAPMLETTPSPTAPKEEEEKEGQITFQHLLQPMKGNARIKSNLFD